LSGVEARAYSSIALEIRQGLDAIYQLDHASAVIKGEKVFTLLDNSRKGDPLSGLHFRAKTDSSYSRLTRTCSGDKNLIRG
jgi:hypothetical protein